MEVTSASCCGPCGFCGGFAALWVVNTDETRNVLRKKLPIGSPMIHPGPELLPHFGSSSSPTSICFGLRSGIIVWSINYRKYGEHGAMDSGVIYIYIYIATADQHAS